MTCSYRDGPAHWIEAPCSERIAAQYAPDRFSRPPRRTMNLDRFLGVVRTGWVVAALTAQPARKGHTVETYGHDQKRGREPTWVTPLSGRHAPLPPRRSSSVISATRPLRLRAPDGLPGHQNRVRSVLRRNLPPGRPKDASSAVPVDSPSNAAGGYDCVASGPGREKQYHRGSVKGPALSEHPLDLRRAHVRGQALGAEARASLAPASSQDGSAGPGTHAQTEPVTPRAPAVVRLVGALALGHGVLT